MISTRDKNTTPRRWWSLFGLVGLVLVLGLLLGCSEQNPEQNEGNQEQQPTAPQVEVWTVGTETLSERRRWSGRLESLRTRNVLAPRRAQVESDYVSDGDRVQKGDVLFRLTEPETSARREVLQQRRDHLQQELERWQQLAQADAAGPAETNEAKLRLLEVEEMLAEVDAALASRVIRAPVDGRVVEKRVTTGSSVSEGKVLARLDDHDTLGVRLSVPTRETKFLEERDHLQVRDDGGRDYEIEKVGYGEDGHRSFAGVELYLADVVEDRRREVEVVYDKQEEIIVVPWTAVASDNRRHRVALVSGDPPLIEERQVELGRAHSAGLEILSGLEPGDQVVHYEPRSHPEGRQVEPVELNQ